MKRGSNVMTPEQWADHMKRRERLAETTDAAIRAGLDAYEAGARGEEVAAAVRAANAKHAPPGRPDPSGLTHEDLPRLEGEGWTADRQRGFLVHLAQTGCVSQACDTVGLSRQSAYKLRNRAPNSVFAICWEVAIHMARQALLDEATERAFVGREVPVWYHGEQVGKRIVHNDRLLMFLLGQKREPLHPTLDRRELTHLFPTMLKMVDAILPPGFSPERIAELTGDENGNPADYLG